MGVDIANNSLKQFNERLISHHFTDPRGYAQQGEHRKVTHLVCADIGTASLTDSVLDCHTWSEGTISCILLLSVALHTSCAA